MLYQINLYVVQKYNLFFVKEVDGSYFCDKEKAIVPINCERAVTIGHMPRLTGIL